MGQGSSTQTHTRLLVVIYVNLIQKITIYLFIVAFFVTLFYTFLSENGEYDEVIAISEAHTHTHTKC